MYKKIITSLLLLVGLGTIQSSAQEVNLSLMTKFDANGVKIKVLPKDAHHWLLGIENGYEISRRELGVESEYRKIHSGVLKPSSEEGWPQNERGKEMYDFHKQAVEKIRNLRSDGPFLASFKAAQRANENYKLYIFITMRDKEFGNYTGLEFIDESAIEGKLYEYRVAISDTDIISLPSIIDAQQNITSPSLNTASKEHAVNLTWMHDEHSSVIGYYVERSETGLNYDRINDGPILPDNLQLEDTIEMNRIFEVTQFDSLSQNYQPYYYRLIGLDIWGDELTPSDPIVGMGIDLTAPKLGGFNIEVNSINRNFVITWDQSMDNDIASYFITQSYILDGLDSVIVSELSPKNDLIYTIDNPLEMQNHYFKIGAIDTSGNIEITESKSVFLSDQTPPTKVIETSFVVDSTGQVSLSWSPSQDTNLKGYWIYRSFEESGDYIKICDTVWTTESFLDTCSLALLNNKRFYFIEALDQNFNTSKPSEIIAVKLPDTIPPSVTIITDIKQEGQDLKITWKENQSEDVVSYLLFKKTTNGEWKRVEQIQKGNNLYIDKNSVANEIQYQILAQDDSGNKCPKGKPFYFSNNKNRAQEFSLSIETSGASSRLVWSDIGSRYKLYKSSGKDFHLVEYLSKNSYEDSIDINITDTAYYVKAFDEKGILITTSEIQKL